jgi:ATP-dependent RNA helicase RhlB
LLRYGVHCAELSGDVPQQKRLRLLEAFRSGRIRVIVATDVAGRGIHVDSIDHVINYDLPYEPEAYVHRNGRTGRVGMRGRAVSFACEHEAFVLPEIEEYIKERLSCIRPTEEMLKLPHPVNPHVDRPPRAGRSGRGRQRRPPPDRRRSRRSG